MTDQEFWQALAPGAEPDPPFFRLYHDAQGWPLFYSMQNEPGNYISIDRETYQNPPKHVRVVDGTLKMLRNSQSDKLVPSKVGTPCDSTDVCVVVGDQTDHIKWNLKTYDPN